MSTLIAMVATAVLVDGVRTVIQPGQALPDLPKHDQSELLANGLAMDPDVQAANEHAKKVEEAAALNAFKAARKKVQAEQESIESPAADGEDTSEPSDPTSTAKAPAKTASKK